MPASAKGADAMEPYGATIERGVIVTVAEAGYKVKSLSRDGIITPAIPAVNGGTFEVGDRVYFFLFDDGHGGIFSAFD